MEFGKLPNVDHVDWTLPPDDPVSSRFLERLSASTLPRLFFGAPLWGSKKWVGRTYPPDAKPANYLRHYANTYTTIELNTSHYRIPSQEQVRKWRDQVPKDFQFCSKIHQSISHERVGLQDRDALKVWHSYAEGLGENGGPSFLQLPPYFDYSDKALLFAFLRQWPEEHRLALEFRHPSWFDESNPGRILPALTEYLQSKKIGLVITDVAGRRDVLHTSISAEFSMLRFIGNDLHPSDESRAEAWAGRFAQWFERGLKTEYLFIHELEDDGTPEMTEVFLKKLREKVKKTKTFELYEPVALEMNPHQMDFLSGGQS